jgi:hypothetical protein
VGGVVGAVPLKNGDTLQITPKIGNFSFFRLLLRCRGLYSELQPSFSELADYAHAEDGGAVVWLVARSFGKCLVEVSKRSRRFDHKFRVQRGTFAAGQIYPVETTLRITQRADNPIVFGAHVREYSTPENRVLGKAAQICLPYLKPAGDEYVKDTAAEWAKEFGHAFDLSDIFEVDRWLLGRRLGGSRGYYVRALALAKVILGQAGLSGLDGGSVLAEGLLLNTPNLFEDYVRKVLVDSHKSSGIILTKGGGLGSQSLYTDGAFKLEPDYVFQNNGKFLLIADAKYKVPDSKDHYQMICYLSRYGVKTGVLFHAVFESRDARHVRHITPDGFVVWEIGLPLKELDSVEATLAQALVRFGSH